MTECSGFCVDLANDKKNCGACGKTCLSDELCRNGTCVKENPQCPHGQVACATGCADLLTDDKNCGSCDLACQPSETCQKGKCLPSQSEKPYVPKEQADAEGDGGLGDKASGGEGQTQDEKLRPRGGFSCSSTEGNLPMLWLGIFFLFCFYTSRRK